MTTVFIFFVIYVVPFGLDVDWDYKSQRYNKTFLVGVK